MLVNIDGYSGLVRDCSSGAVLNTNKSEYENFLTKRKKLLQEKQLLQQRDVEIAELKSEISELKQLVATLANVINNKTST